jgi:hypothetical protein
MTSGTTGASKFIPESLAAMTAKRITSDTRAQALADAVPGLHDAGKILTFANRRVFGYTPCGIEYGTASGSNITSAPPLGPERLAYPLSILDHVDKAADVDYLILLTSLQNDVRVIRGNNPGRLTALLGEADARRDELISDIRHGTVSASVQVDPTIVTSLGLRADPARADAMQHSIHERGALTAQALWPDLRGLVFWLSGSVGRFMKGLLPLMPEGLVQMDIGYGASEGRFNVPLEPGRAAGPLSLAAQFFEFIPAEGGDPLLAHELTDGETYRILVTTYSGLFRYDMKDLVRVDGFTGATPNIVFEAKAGDVANIAGEKMAGPRLLNELSEFLDREGIRARHFLVVTDLDRHGYDLCIEFDHDSVHPDESMLPRLEASLSEVTVAYQIFRDQSILAPSRIVVMKQGWQDTLYDRQMAAGLSRAQIKLRLIDTDRVDPAQVAQIIG